MNDAAGCPADATLRQYLQGELDEASGADLPIHLVRCERCAARALTLVPGGSFLAGSGLATTQTSELGPQARERRPPIEGARGSSASLAFVAIVALLVGWGLPSPFESALAPDEAAAQPPAAAEPEPVAAAEAPVPRRPAAPLEEALRELEARAPSLDATERRALWEDFLSQARGGPFEHYARQRLERLQRQRLEAAQRRFAEIRRQWIYDFAIVMDFESAFAALDGFDEEFPDLLRRESASLRESIERRLGQGGRPSVVMGLKIADGELLADPRLKVEAREQLVVEADRIRFVKAGQSALELSFELEQPPASARLEVVLAVARFGDTRRGCVDLHINDELVFGGWQPYSYEWAIYEWDIASALVPGENRLRLSLGALSLNQVWLRRLRLIGQAEAP